MTDYEVAVGGRQVPAPDGWRVQWLDPDRRMLCLTDGSRTLLAVVEGSGTDWAVTLRGRRIPVTVRTWRERVLADAQEATATAAGPLEVHATLPGLVVAVNVTLGQEVGEGASLLTIEAMKMQNEVRAPRAGRVAEVAVEPGRPVATGALLLRLEAP